MKFHLKKLSNRQDIILIIMLILSVFMIIFPLPTLLIDFFIAINLTIALILLMISIYIEEPLDFSSFPSVLLITTLFRLSLTISTSRLILLQHNAGEIIYTFGNYVVNGNLLVGLIIFFIITIVQFIVITKGSERVAEVGARFSLDGMPGKQMSIDGDLRAGNIDSKEAKKLRLIVQKESQLYGAMDGAMKFIKGDAIASIIIILVNIIGGILIGIIQHKMTASNATETYSILSIGDGLISQIPSLLISLTAGIIVTRVPGEKKQNLAKSLSSQIMKHEKSLSIGALVLLIFAFIPGFPFFVFLFLSLLIFISSIYVKKNRINNYSQLNTNKNNIDLNHINNIKPGAIPLILKININEIKYELLIQEIDRFRKNKFEQLGIALPEISVIKSKNEETNYFEILLYQESVFKEIVDPGYVLCKGPYGTIKDAKKYQSSLDLKNHYLIKESLLDSVHIVSGKYFNKEQRIIYLLDQVIIRYQSEFLGIQETKYLMDGMESKYADLVNELQRSLQISKISDILKRLLVENISIRDLRKIFETLLEWAPKEKDIILLTEYVRISLSRHIVSSHINQQGKIDACLIGDNIENIIRESIRQTSSGGYSSLSQSQNEKIIEKITSALETISNKNIVLVTSVDVRKYLRKIIENKYFEISTLSYQEIGNLSILNIIKNVDIIGDIDDETDETDETELLSNT